MATIAQDKKLGLPAHRRAGAPTGGVSLGVAYDLGRPTTAVRYLLGDLTTIVLEANHDEMMLRTNSYPASPINFDSTI